MSALIAGAASGLLMASVFISFGAIMLLPFVKDPPPGLRALFNRVSPFALVMSVTLLAYPVWGTVGAVAGLLYRVSLEEPPRGGLGSPNLVFTLAIVVLAVMVAAPLAWLLRRVVTGVLAMAATFTGVFGWLLPYFAG